jgi:hypothetical protein
MHPLRLLLDLGSTLSAHRCLAVFRLFAASSLFFLLLLSLATVPHLPPGSRAIFGNGCINLVEFS